PKLIKAGYRVAICEQLEDPKMTKNIVKRGVTEIITPGLANNDSILDSKKNNFLCSIVHTEKKFGIAFIDISTGEFSISSGSEALMEKLISSYQPSEILIPRGNKSSFFKRLSQQYYTYTLEDWVYGSDYSKEVLLKKFQTTSLKGFGIENYDEATTAGASILHYLDANEQKKMDHVRSIRVLTNQDCVWLDNFTIRNLELVQGQHAQATSLFDILNHTQSSMGARMMQRWILLPLISLDRIQFRQNLVEYLIQNRELKDQLSHILKQIGDLERLISKVSMLKCTPRDISQLAKSQQNTIELIRILQESESKEFIHYTNFLNPCQSLIDLISEKLIDEPPAALNKGFIFKKGFHQDYDEYLSLVTDGKQYLLEIQNREQELTQITNLKIGFNNVFGYYLEVTNSHKDKVPETWIRKQTLSNAERYITPELKEYETKILGAEEKLTQIQDAIWMQMLEEIKTFTEPIQLNANTIAEIDCLVSFSVVAVTNDYCKPEINDSKTIKITQGRHPVIEKQLAVGEYYIPNDILLDNDDQQIIMLTGPNMSGKSALLRQTALIVLMAQ
ncbi:MAG: DNA mismatch repair protein MutS, partial [Chitinophagales bacterium]